MPRAGKAGLQVAKVLLGKRMMPPPRYRIYGSQGVLDGCAILPLEVGRIPRYFENTFFVCHALPAVWELAAHNPGKPRDPPCHREVELHEVVKLSTALWSIPPEQRAVLLSSVYEDAHGSALH